MTPEEKFYQNLYTILEKKGMTARTLSSKLERHGTFISTSKARNNSMTLGTMVKISNILGVSISTLLKGCDTVNGIEEEDE